jgi:flagellar basal-body rod protein FlgF
VLYGLYLSAAGVMTSSYKQDVLANNLANSETAGFKRDVPAFRQRLTEAQERRASGDATDAVLEGLGGGMFSMPTGTSFEQGPIEQTGSALDVAIEGNGFFVTKQGDQTRLTRDGRFSVDREGRLVLGNGQPVLSDKGKPITLSPDAPTRIDKNGAVTQNSQIVAKLGLFDVQDRSTLKKLGGGLFAPADPADLKDATGTLRSEYVERSNVDPTTELTELMDAQRQLEANANMIRTQDSTLQRLVNDVGKIS